MVATLFLSPLLFANMAFVIIVLFKMTAERGALDVILLFFPPYVFVWGWRNAQRLQFEPIMLTWTACIFTMFSGLGMLVV